MVHEDTKKLFKILIPVTGKYNDWIMGIKFEREMIRKKENNQSEQQSERFYELLRHIVS
jgi:hypothetical protein